jgi:putative phosphoesterase
MKILVLSDSHSGLSFARRCISAVKPNAIIHLGDYFDDGEVLHEENIMIPFCQVPGNCDRYRVSPFQPEILIEPVLGVSLYMTHGHRHDVKRRMDKLLQDARASKVQAVLYGHTHISNCYQEPDGLWVLNPGSCGSYSGSAGLIEVENKKITACRLLREADLEEFV